MTDWRENLVVVLSKFGVPVAADCSDEELLKRVDEVRDGRAWTCSTCGSSLFPWEDCCN